MKANLVLLVILAVIIGIIALIFRFFGPEEPPESASRNSLVPELQTCSDEERKCDDGTEIRQNGPECKYEVCPDGSIPSGEDDSLFDKEGGEGDAEPKGEKRF